MIGTTVGSYRIVSKLSIGGMGTVYRAEHTLIGKTAAVKVLHPELSANQEIVDRFFNEAKATTTIKHPGIVDVFDFGYMESGHAFLVMEFLDGMSLAKRCKAGKMAEGEAAMLLRGVCSALTAAHDRHIVHRDLKPDNIFLVPDADTPTGERPKILDFGIAKLTDIGMAGSGTKTGAVMGTPTYMSPEQCRGTGQVDHRADLYSIGCIYYEMLTGRPPFTNLGAGELIGAHLYVPPQPPSKFLPTITPESLNLIMALLEKKPEKRPQSAKELAARLLAIAHMHDIGRNTPNPLARSLTPLPVPREVPEDAVFDEDGETLRTPDGPEAELRDRARVTEPTEPPAYPSEPSLPIAIAPLEKPTTLSGAATSSIIDVPKRSRRGVIAGIAAAAVVAIGGIALVLGMGGKNTAESPKPTASPTTTAPAPVAAPAPVVTPPAPTPTPPPETAGEGSGSAAAVTEDHTVEKTPTVAEKKPVEKKPVAKPTKKPTNTTATKPTKKPEKKNTLIETDL